MAESKIVCQVKGGLSAKAPYFRLREGIIRLELPADTAFIECRSRVIRRIIIQSLGSGVSHGMF
jgi:hypothetical protein